MDNYLIEILSGFAGVILGGIISFFVFKWVYSRQSATWNYNHTDSLYINTVKLYVDHPQFGDPEKTRSYVTAFKENELWQYHYFALNLHTFLETIYDLHLDERHDKIEYVWECIFDYHAKLHLEWLKNNKESNHSKYIDFVLRRFDIGKVLKQ